jgi:regulator of protease activity HflC (stomatin/prohibitin superfamily)
LNAQSVDGARAAWIAIVLVVVSLPHAIEDFAFGEPARVGVAPIIALCALLVAYAVQGLGAWLALRENPWRAIYRGHRIRMVCGSAGHSWSRNPRARLAVALRLDVDRRTHADRDRKRVGDVVWAHRGAIGIPASLTAAQFPFVRLSAHRSGPIAGASYYSKPTRRKTVVAPVRRPETMNVTIIEAMTILVIVIVLSGIRVAQEFERAVVFRLGRYAGTRGPGMFYLVPFIEWQRMVDVRTITDRIEQQETITKDSVTIKINAVLWFRVVDPEKSVIAIVDYREAAYQVAVTSLRSIVGRHALDDVLRERDAINARLREVVDQAVAPWGMTVSLVEMKDVEIPALMQRAMAREAEAIREKRARIIKADAEYESSRKLAAAAKEIEQGHGALELRRLQMITEVGAEHNSTTIIMIPSEITSMARAIADKVSA